MKRILLVTDAWYPQVNGVVTVFAKISSLLEARGYEVLRIEPSQFRTIPLPLYPEIRFALFPKRKVSALIRSLTPDAVHIATEGPLGLAARNYCIKQQIPFTTSYHTHFQLHLEAYMGSALFTKAFNAFLRWFHAPAVRTMVATESLKKTLVDMGMRHLVVWSLGVDTQLFVRTVKEITTLKKPVFVYFGRLAQEKNIEEFLKLDLPGTKLVIGDGPKRTYLEKKYGRQATFVGYKRGQELVDWLSLCDVFVFPSRTETFGLVVVEALACGIPVAAHDVMGPRDIITQGRDGYLSDDLKQAALDCLKLFSDDCRAKALQYTWEHSVDMFLQNLVYLS